MTRQGGGPEDWRPVVGVFRLLRRWQQRELAQASGVDARQISLYELGREAPSPETVRRLAAGAGVPLGWVEPLRDLFRALRLAMEGRADGDDGGDAGSGIAVDLIPAVADAVRLALAPALLELDALAGTEEAPPSAAAERAWAAEIWPLLERATPRQRRLLLDSAGADRTRAVCEQACAASERAAAADAGRAHALAELALEVARLSPGGEGPRTRLEARAWAFVGNARRVAGKLHAADEAFAEARRLRERAGAGAGLEALDLGQELDLEASLRRDQRRFAEALALHERALSAGPPAGRGSILLNKSKVQVELQDYAGALATLEEAARWIDERSDPRSLLVLRFNMASNLCHLGRHAEAERLLPEVRELAARLGNGLDSVRLSWLEGRVAAGLGRKEEALAALEEVRGAFATREIDYDMALVSLDLAVLHLEQGDTGRVKDLAGEMEPIFLREGVHREALAALRVFCEAAAKERATEEMARRLHDYLERARHDPGLRFEGR